jgi:hypothetical protein
MALAATGRILGGQNRRNPPLEDIERRRVLWLRRIGGSRQTQRQAKRDNDTHGTTPEVKLECATPV